MLPGESPRPSTPTRSSSRSADGQPPASQSLESAIGTLQVTVESLRGHQAIGQQEQDGAVLPLDRPVQTGGLGLGFNGGHLLLLSWGGCFKSSLIAAAEARDIRVSTLRLDVRGETGDTPVRFTELHMDVELVTDADAATNEKLLLIAERGCMVSTTLARSCDLHVRLV